AAADQLVALLGPHAAAAGEHPHRAGIAVVARPADHGGVAVGGQRDREALLDDWSNRAGADQLGTLLGPHAAAAGEPYAAPTAWLSRFPPTVAVLPSADNATEWPWPPPPPVPTSFACCVQSTPLRVNTHAAPRPKAS